MAMTYPAAKKITVILDNARYYRSKVVAEYLQNSRIELMFLPPYSPNLNLIERFWKFFKKQVLYNQYYGTFRQFKSACEFFSMISTIITSSYARCSLKISRLFGTKNRKPI